MIPSILLPDITPRLYTPADPPHARNTYGPHPHQPDHLITLAAALTTLDFATFDAFLNTVTHTSLHQLAWTRFRLLSMVLLFPADPGDAQDMARLLLKFRQSALQGLQSTEPDPTRMYNRIRPPSKLSDHPAVVSAVTLMNMEFKPKLPPQQRAEINRHLITEFATIKYLGYMDRIPQELPAVRLDILASTRILIIPAGEGDEHYADISDDQAYDEIYERHRIFFEPVGT